MNAAAVLDVFGSPCGGVGWSSGRSVVKRTKSKRAGGLVTRRIVYGNRLCPHDRPQELRVDVRRGELIDTDYAAAMVAVRTSLSLHNVKIFAIEGAEE